MRADDFRRMALALDGAIESAHIGHPDFRVGNRIFATLHTDDRFGMVALTPEQQRELIDEHPEMFSPEAGAWGRGGSTRVHLAAAQEEVIGVALTLAWQNAIRKNNEKRSPRKLSGRATRN
jgi:YjbR